MVLANQPDMVVVEKWDKKLVVVDIAIPSDSNIRKMELEKLKKNKNPMSLKGCWA